SAAFATASALAAACVTAAGIAASRVAPAALTATAADRASPTTAWSAATTAASSSRTAATAGAPSTMLEERHLESAGDAVRSGYQFDQLRRRGRPQAGPVRSGSKSRREPAHV